MIGTYTKVSISCVGELEWDLGSWKRAGWIRFLWARRIIRIVFDS